MGITLEEAHKLKSDMSVDYQLRAVAQRIVNAYNAISETQQRLYIQERQLEQLQNELEFTPSPIGRLWPGGLSG